MANGVTLDLGPGPWDDPNPDEMAENEQSQGSVRVVSGSGFRYVIPFPWRLHQMLEEIENAGDASTVSWLPNGRHFQVHNPQDFVDKVIPRFFKQKSYKSFQRQLHLYGFQRETDGQNRGAYFHESFMRDNRQLALEISRIKAPKRRKSPVSKVVVNTSTNDIYAVATAPLSTVDKFTRLDRKDLPRGPIRSIKPVMTTPKVGFDPVMTFRQQRCSCPHKSNGLGHHVCTHTRSQLESVSTVSSSSSVSRDDAVSETYNWLINAGVPCTAFDPSLVDNTQELFECADEITSLFSNAPERVHSSSHPAALSTPLESPVAAPQSFGFNELDASLDIPHEMLGDLNSAIWGL